MRVARLLRFSVAFFGAGMAFVAVFAYPLGLDNNPRLGSSRAALLAFGLVLVWLAVGPVLGALVRKSMASAKGRQADRRPPPHDDSDPGEAGLGIPKADLTEAPAADDGAPLAASDRQPRPRLSLSSDGRTNAFLLGVLAVALVSAWWLGTAGTWSNWPTSTDYYARLAESFRAGSLHLLEQPDSRLLELADPYEYEAREGLTYPWDVSYYEGRYYLYWGPAPAAILALIDPFGGDPVTDDQIVFASVIGIISLSLLLLRLLQLLSWRCFPLLAAFLLKLFSLLMLTSHRFGLLFFRAQLLCGRPCSL